MTLCGPYFCLWRLSIFGSWGIAHTNSSLLLDLRLESASTSVSRSAWETRPADHQHVFELPSLPVSSCKLRPVRQNCAKEVLRVRGDEISSQREIGIRIRRAECDFHH